MQELPAKFRRELLLAMPDRSWNLGYNADSLKVKKKLVRSMVGPKVFILKLKGVRLSASSF
jgi:hypothetical protein